MSKTVDLSDLEALSEDDLRYAWDRDLITDEEFFANTEDPNFRPLHEGTPLDEVANTGDANTTGLTIEQLEAKLAAMKAEQSSGDEEDDDEEEDEEDVEYSSMTNDELRTEIARRNDGREDAEKLSLEGNKATLIATLEGDDEDEED